MSGCVEAAGGMAQWGGWLQLSSWKPEPPDLATSPDPPSSQGAPFPFSRGESGLRGLGLAAWTPGTIQGHGQGPHQAGSPTPFSGIIAPPCIPEGGAAGSAQNQETLGLRVQSALCSAHLSPICEAAQGGPAPGSPQGEPAEQASAPLPSCLTCTWPRGTWLPGMGPWSPG